MYFLIFYHNLVLKACELYHLEIWDIRCTLIYKEGLQENKYRKFHDANWAIF